ncbi:hypothetical protein OROGR_001674 [Orobanche gracilis]
MATISRRSPLGDVVLFLTTSPFHFPSPSHFDSAEPPPRHPRRPAQSSSSHHLTILDPEAIVELEHQILDSKPPMLETYIS